MKFHRTQIKYIYKTYGSKIRKGKSYRSTVWTGFFFQRTWTFVCNESGFRWCRLGLPLIEFLIQWICGIRQKALYWWPTRSSPWAYTIALHRLVMFRCTVSLSHFFVSNAALDEALGKKPSPLGTNHIRWGKNLGIGPFRCQQPWLKVIHQRDKGGGGGFGVRSQLGIERNVLVDAKFKKDVLVFLFVSAEMQIIPRSHCLSPARH